MIHADTLIKAFTMRLCECALILLACSGFQSTQVGLRKNITIFDKSVPLIVTGAIASHYVRIACNNRVNMVEVKCNPISFVDGLSVNSCVCIDEGGIESESWIRCISRPKRQTV